MKIKNYNDLRIKTQTLLLLVVLELPQDESQHMTISSEEIALRRRAFWLSLQQYGEVLDQQTTTIDIP